jgi:hypothetical protein
MGAVAGRSPTDTHVSKHKFKETSVSHKIFLNYKRNNHQFMLENVVRDQS